MKWRAALRYAVNGADEFRVVLRVVTSPLGNICAFRRRPTNQIRLLGFK